MDEHLRAYLAKKYRLSDDDSKGSDFVRVLLASDAVSDDDKKALRTIFERLNEAKYGGALLHREEIDEVQKRISNFIKQKKVVMPQNNNKGGA